jgi:uncharacterized protein (TIGR00725 family)
MDNPYQSIIAVIGAGSCDEETYTIAEEAGILLAKNGFTIICGGLGGVMEAVCKGARSEGGHTIGVLPGDNIRDANPYVSIPVATGMGIGRNIIIIRTAMAVLAIDGKYGTLSEIAFALQLQKPVVGLQSWDVSADIIQASNIEQAVNEIVKIADKS